MAALADRFGLARLFYPGGEVVMFDGAFDAGEPAQDRPYEVVEGIARSSLYRARWYRSSAQMSGFDVEFDSVFNGLNLTQH
jgi:hypothetical protein